MEKPSYHSRVFKPRVMVRVIPPTKDSLSFEVRSVQVLK